eukprot:gene40851-50245_t
MGNWAKPSKHYTLRGLQSIRYLPNSKPLPRVQREADLDGEYPISYSYFTFFVNLFLADRIPRTLARIVVSGSLVPVLKKDGGIRPIVVGEVFRRLISKL